MGVKDVRERGRGKKSDKQMVRMEERKSEKEREREKKKDFLPFTTPEHGMKVSTAVSNIFSYANALMKSAIFCTVTS